MIQTEKTKSQHLNINLCIYAVFVCVCVCFTIKILKAKITKTTQRQDKQFNAKLCQTNKYLSNKKKAKYDMSSVCSSFIVFCFISFEMTSSVCCLCVCVCVCELCPVVILWMFYYSCVYTICIYQSISMTFRILGSANRPKLS